MEDASRVALLSGVRGEGLIWYIQRTLQVREHLRQGLTAPYIDEQVFTAALAHFSRGEAPAIAAVHIQQPAAYWFHTGQRAYIMLTASDEESYRQGVMLLGYHLLTQMQVMPMTPAICSPFESSLWRLPAFFWPRFFYHCLIADNADYALPLLA